MIKYIIIGVKRKLDQDKKFNRSKSVKLAILQELAKIGVMLTSILFLLTSPVFFPDSNPNTFSRYDTLPPFILTFLVIVLMLYVILSRKVEKSVGKYEGPLTKEEFKPYIWYLIFWGNLIILAAIVSRFEIHKYFLN